MKSQEQMEKIFLKKDKFSLKKQLKCNKNKSRNINVPALGDKSEAGLLF